MALHSTLFTLPVESEVDRHVISSGANVQGSTSPPFGESCQTYTRTTNANRNFSSSVLDSSLLSSHSVVTRKRKVATTNISPFLTNEHNKLANNVPVSHKNFCKTPSSSDFRSTEKDDVDTSNFGCALSNGKVHQNYASYNISQQSQSANTTLLNNVTHVSTRTSTAMHLILNQVDSLKESKNGNTPSMNKICINPPSSLQSNLFLHSNTRSSYPMNSSATENDISSVSSNQRDIISVRKPVTEQIGVVGKKSNKRKRSTQMVSKSFKPKVIQMKKVVIGNSHSRDISIELPEKNNVPPVITLDPPEELLVQSDHCGAKSKFHQTVQTLNDFKIKTSVEPIITIDPGGQDVEILDHPPSLSGHKFQKVAPNSEESDLMLPECASETVNHTILNSLHCKSQDDDNRITYQEPLLIVPATVAESLVKNFAPTSNYQNLVNSKCKPVKSGEICSSQLLKTPPSNNYGPLRSTQSQQNIIKYNSPQSYVATVNTNSDLLRLKTKPSQLSQQTQLSSLKAMHSAPIPLKIRPFQQHSEQISQEMSFHSPPNVSNYSAIPSPSFELLNQQSLNESVSNNEVQRKRSNVCISSNNMPIKLKKQKISKVKNDQSLTFSSDTTSIRDSSSSTVVQVSENRPSHVKSSHELLASPNKVVIGRHFEGASDQQEDNLYGNIRGEVGKNKKSLSKVIPIKFFTGTDFIRNPFLDVPQGG